MGRKSDNIVLAKAKAFAIRSVRLYQHLCESKKEFILSKQLLRSATSIGANLFEAQESISHKEFAAKVYISLKEARESEYWIELLHDTNFITQFQYDSLSADINELLRILITITKNSYDRSGTAKDKIRDIHNDSDNIDFVEEPIPDYLSLHLNNIQNSTFNIIEEPLSKWSD